MPKKRKLFQKKTKLKGESQNSDTITFGANLDTDEILPLGAPLPITWSFYPDGRVKVRDETWFDSKFGDAVVSFKREHSSLGGYDPKRAKNCLFPNGKRGLAVAGSHPNNSNEIVWRRPTSERGLWWPGSVKFSPDDAVFSDNEELLPIETIDENENKPWLADALMGQDMPENKIFWTEFYNACTKSDLLKSKIRMDTYAWAFWELFIDQNFIYKPTGAEIYYTSDRTMGEVLSRLRGCGENYIDFYHGLHDGLGPRPKDKEKNEILEIFAKLDFVVKPK